MYDWANSAYSTYQITILMLYLQQVVLPGRVWTDCLWLRDRHFDVVRRGVVPGSGRRGRCACQQAILAVRCTLAGACAGVAMYFLPVEIAWVICRACFSSTSLGFELAWGIVQRFLPEIADETSMNRVSAYGFAMGYIGGGLALLVGVLIVQFGDSLGLAVESAKGIASSGTNRFST